MKLSTFINDSLITERLKITSNTQSYRPVPASKDELISIIKDELESQGPDADLNHIDTYKVTDMSYLFANKNIGNIKIDKWNVSNVTNMSHMFNLCYKFNSDLSDWNTRNVTSMYSMFSDCDKFEGTGLDNWDVSNVTTMEGMFSWCKKLNVDLSSWRTSNVSNMKYMYVLLL